MDAFGHLKTIAHSDAAMPLLVKAGVEVDEGVVAPGDFVAAASKRYWAREPAVRMLA
jgi:catalase